VPELARDGDVDVEGAVVFDDVADTGALRAAFDAGTPVVVRASSAEQIKVALARPEVACVLVPPDREDLLGIDLTELTYG
jgi:DNA-binding sugar fermentation-stimulating protein